MFTLYMCSYMYSSHFTHHHLHCSCCLDQDINSLGNIQWNPTISEPLKCGHLVLTLWYEFAFPLTAIHYNLWDADTPLFRKAHKFFRPGLYMIMRTLTCLSHKFVGHNWSVQHYNSICSHSSSLWSAFLTGVRTARESSRMCLHSSQQHGYALPHLPEIHWKPPKYRRLYIPDMQQ